MSAVQLQVDQANSSGRTPVVFVHGLWLLPSSWDRWAAVFDDAGYAPVTPGWPDDPETVEEARAHPEVFAGKTAISQAAYKQTEEQPGRRRIRGDPGSRARADHRQWLARGRRHRTDLHPPVRVTAVRADAASVAGCHGSTRSARSRHD